MNKEEQLLLNIIEEVTRRYKEILKEHTILLKQIEKKANEDPLTGLFNRQFFTEKVQSLLKNNFHICIVFLDLDNFKYVNDTYGHEIGDKILLEFTRILKSFFKGKDIIARIGGDEFVVAMIDCNKEEINSVLYKLLNEVKEHFKFYNVTTSIGVTFAPDESKNLKELLKIADKRMYLVKKTGKNGFAIDEENVFFIENINKVNKN